MGCWWATSGSAARSNPVLFPFGYGLSYTSFAWSGLAVAPDGRSARVTVRNVGLCVGRAVAELYASLPASANAPQRLVGWATVNLAPGEQREVSIPVEPLTLAVYDVVARAFTIMPGEYAFHAGNSSTDLPLAQTISLPGEQHVP